MKLSNSYFFTLRENPKDEDSLSAQLLTRSGMIEKTSSGIYMFLPLGFKVLKNIEQIIREEMNKVSAQELNMPTLILKDVYDKSGRGSSFGPDMFNLKDRYSKDYVLGPTHEELFTIAAKNMVRSYKDMPFNLYQFQSKFRDEIRPRYGLIRVREFIMKDAYSFDVDLDGLEKSYQKMYKAYQNIFDRMLLNYKIVTADTGNMGGLLSEEFQAITDIGEDTIVLCDSCSLSSNIEVTPCVSRLKQDVLKNEKELIKTPNAKTIEEVAQFLNEDKEKFVKTLIYNVDKDFYAILVKGDDEVNITKLKKLLSAKDITLAESNEVIKITNAEIGFAGPISLDVKIVIDNEILNMSNFIVGANKTDYHYKNVNLNDFKYTLSGDIRNIKENDICPLCGGKIKFAKGIEIGNIFKLGTKYSEAFNLTYLDKFNESKPVVMGSYGIGLARCMAAIVEQNNDENGILWPLAVAPYKIAIVIANVNDKNQLEEATKIYEELNKNNIDVLLDDRDERIGIKFNDMDLIGIPLRITIGNKITENIVELKLREKTNSIDIDKNNIIEEIKQILK